MLLIFFSITQQKFVDKLLTREEFPLSTGASPTCRIIPQCRHSTRHQRQATNNDQATTSAASSKHIQKDFFKSFYLAIIASYDQSLSPTTHLTVMSFLVRLLLLMNSHKSHAAFKSKKHIIY
jgi:hypothetical protein